MKCKAIHVCNQPSAWLFAVLGILFSHCTSSPGGSNKNNCSRFKRGNFHLHSRHNGMNFTIIRLDSLEIETEEATGRKSKWKVKWQNDCEYSLEFIHEKNTPSAIGSTLISIPILHCAITSSGEKYYTYSCIINKNEPPLTDTIWQITD